LQEPPGDPPDDPPGARAALAVLASLMAYWGFLDAVNGAAAPHLARDFGLGDSGIAGVFGWTALGALVSLPVARAADRRGRRRVLLGAVAALLPACLVSALAPSLVAFVAAQVVVQALKGVLLALIPVMVAEALAAPRRTRGQALVGLTGALGSGLALVLVAACAQLPGSWRWGWALAAAGVLALPFAARSLAESGRFELSAAAGHAQRSRARELWSPRYRRRTLGAILVSAFFPFATAGSQAWLIYHPVRNLGLEQWLATGIVIGGGALAILGFPIGGRLAESWGRRATFGVASLVYVTATTAFYRVPADLAPHPGFALAACFGAMGMASSAALVPVRAAGTELFPTHLRGAISGLLGVSTAAAVVAVNFAVALAARALGGIGPAASLAACAMLLGTVAFYALVPESRGQDLEEAPPDALLR
jgi:MFS family permease